VAQPTAKTIPHRFSIVPVKFAWTAGTTSATLVDWMAGDILLAKNGHATDAKTFTVISKPKSRRADNTITAFSLAAGEYAVLPRFGPQDDEVVSVVSESTDIKWARLSTQAQPA
jgi:hypothetical protein